MQPATKLHTHLGVFEINNSSVFDAQEVVNRYCRRRKTDLDSEITRRMHNRTAAWASQDFFDACCRSEEMYIGLAPVRNVSFLVFLIKTTISIISWLLLRMSSWDLLCELGVHSQYLIICEILRQFFLFCANNL